MRWFARVFASAVARRLAYVLVASVLAWIGIAESRAQSASCGPNPVACDEGQAYARAYSIAGGSAGLTMCRTVSVSTSTVTSVVVSLDAAGVYSGYVKCSGTSGQFKVTDTYFFPNSSCATRDEEFSWTGSQQVCSEGCTYQRYQDPGTGQVYYSTFDSATNAVLGLCTTGEAPKVDTDGDGEPDESDVFPNDPNETKDTDGDGIGDNADIADADAGNGQDTPGEDDGDDEGDNQASGGGDCNAPPSCSGDGIACNTNWQIWRMRCGSGGPVTGDVTNCAAAYTCNADPVQCAQLAVMRVEACKAGSGDGDGTGEGAGDQPAWTEGAEPPRPDEGAEPAENDVKRFGVGIGPDLLDREEIFGAGSCPAFPSFKIMGVTIDPSDIDSWCTIVAIMRAAVLLMAGYFALQILMGRVV